MSGAPRRTVRTDPMAVIMGYFNKVWTRLDKLERGSSLRNSSISGGNGLSVYDDDNKLRLKIDVSGSVTAYDEAGAVVSRYGRLVETVPGEYGVEINVDGSWVRLGYQVVGWSQLSKPAGYDAQADEWDPRPHQHPASDITGAVPKASQADGPTAEAFARDIAASPGNYAAAWMTDNGLLFGKNTSSARYKDNIRPYRVDPVKTLQLQPAMFDRKPATPGAEPMRNEYGLIAEQVLQHTPELVGYWNGEVDSVRYDLLALALLDVVKYQEQRLQAVEGKLGIVPALKALVSAFPVFKRP